MFEIGQMLCLTKQAIKRGKRYAIAAWEWKKSGLDFFSGNVPKDSNNYESWFEHLCKSAGYCLEIDGEWVKIQYMHLDTPFWIKCSNLEICK